MWCVPSQKVLFYKFKSYPSLHTYAPTDRYGIYSLQYKNKITITKRWSFYVCLKFKLWWLFSQRIKTIYYNDKTYSLVGKLLNKLNVFFSIHSWESRMNTSFFNITMVKKNKCNSVIIKCTNYISWKYCTDVPLSLDFSVRNALQMNPKTCRWPVFYLSFYLQPKRCYMKNIFVMQEKEITFQSKTLFMLRPSHGRCWGLILRLLYMKRKAGKQFSTASSWGGSRLKNISVSAVCSVFLLFYRPVWLS